MRLGIDFDNTIVCYDGVFHSLALSKGLIPPSLPSGKSSVRDYLRAVGKEDAWTRLQGEVYGGSMRLAPAFSGVLAFFARARQRGIDLFIISHRTQHPYEGPCYDLHQAAHDWLTHNGFFRPDSGGLSRDRVFLEGTKLDKLRRIGAVGCTHFIDDLPEILGDPAFPHTVEPILFDPSEGKQPKGRCRRVGSWTELEQGLLIL
jgi:hypothetical protein